jgi:hypothetical protein
MFLKVFMFYCFLSFSFSLISCVDLTQIENNLSTQEESHSFSVAFNAIEKSSRAGFIAEEIVNEMRYKFGGKWNCFIFIDRNPNGAFNLQVSYL